LDEILDDLTAHLNYELDERRTTVEVSAGTLEQLVAAPAALPFPPPGASAGTGESPDSRALESGDSLNKVAADIAACRRCQLCEKRTKTVPGQGSPTPEIMFVGEAPGADEDRQGLAFVGRAGQLLTKMILAMGYTRDEVFIANINKCRPPGNRAPSSVEMETCMPFLRRQIAILQPRVIIAMGKTAVDGLVGLPPDTTISRFRGTWTTFEGIDLMPTFHPSYLLRTPSAKRPVWEDLQTVLRHIGRSIPQVKKG